MTDKKKIYKEILNPDIKKVVLSPHYDDVLLSLGGIAKKWKENNCVIEDWIMFSKSNYIKGDKKGNQDNSNKRVKKVSNIRFKEEKRTAEKLGISKIRPFNLSEALLRGHEFKNLRERIINSKDREALDSLKEIIRPLLSEDIHIFVPLGIGHIDHYLVKKAILELINENKKVKSEIFFYEDMPYISRVPKKELKKLRKLIKGKRITPIDIPIDLKHKLELLPIYESQKINSYSKEIINRTKELDNQERIYLYGLNNKANRSNRLKSLIKKILFLDRKKIIIGVGTGRCGTCSLANILDKQKNCAVTHESNPLLFWEFSKEKINQKLQSLLDYKGKFVGDIASYYLPYVEYILKRYPSTKVICLKRPKQETVKSFMKITPRFNHWVSSKMMEDKGDYYIDYKKRRWIKNYWDNCFPKYDVKSKEEALELYWEEYYEEIERLQKKYPKNMMIISTEDLNSEDKLRKILSFIGIPKKHQKLLTNMKYESVYWLKDKKDKKKPLVSVIIPTFNRKRLIKKAIESVLNQSYKNFELIIVDDGSTDGTEGFIKKLSRKNKKIRYIKNKHKKGLPGARNQGIEISKGEFIAFLDSDDEWLKHHLKDSINTLRKYNLDACASLLYEKLDNKIHKVREKHLKKAVDYCNPISKENFYIFNKKLAEFFIIDKTMLVASADILVLRKSILDKIGSFDESLLTSEDTELSFRLYLNSNFCWINNHHAIYNRGNEDSLHAFKNKNNISKVKFDNKGWIKARKKIRKFLENNKNLPIDNKKCIKILNNMIKEKIKNQSKKYL